MADFFKRGDELSGSRKARTEPVEQLLKEH
jgi:hypothetical protein